jgi:hypothetical protein
MLTILPQPKRITLLEALTLWIDVTGVDPASKLSGWTYGSMGVMDMHQALKEALELDPTEITGLLLFEYIVSLYLKERTFTMEMLLDEPEKVAHYLEKSRTLKDFLHSAEMKSTADGFSSKMRQAITSYGAETTDITMLLDSPHRLAMLRRDAMRTMKHLEVHQFLKGNSESEETRPVYGKFVYDWVNINSMLRAMVNAPSGITVNMIRNPVDPYQGYFAFAIRNGGNLFVFTDREKTAHPLAADLSRRQDKVLANRAARNWFPYELLGMQFDEEGHCFIEKPSTTALLPHQAQAYPIKAIAELEASTVLWLTMMLDLIVDKFWHQEFQAPQLSFTGEMIKINTPLVNAAKAANLQIVKENTLSMKPLTMNDVRGNNLSEESIGKNKNHQNQWLEDRYGHLVTDEAMNLLMLPHEVIQMDTTDGLGSISAIDKNKARSIANSHNREDGARHITLNAVDPSSFGTQEQIERDRRFIARSNYAKQIDRLAEQEFDRRKTEVQRWVREHIEGNYLNLLPMMRQETVIVDCEKLASGEHGAFNTWRGETKRQFMSRYSLTGEFAYRLKGIYRDHGEGKFVFNTPGNWKKGAPCCFLTGGPSAFSISFHPETTSDLALMCGCTINDLPDVLQNWTQIEKTEGNHILDHVDPMVWQLHNPWTEFTFQSTYYVSVRGLAQICSI